MAFIHNTDNLESKPLIQKSDPKTDSVDSVDSDFNYGTNVGEKSDIDQGYYTLEQIYQALLDQRWLDSWDIHQDPGQSFLVLMTESRHFVSLPTPSQAGSLEKDYKDLFVNSIAPLGIKIAARISYPAVDLILDVFDSLTEVISLDKNTNIQLLESITALPYARRNQYCAFIRDESSLICWADHEQDLIPWLQEIDSKIKTYIHKRQSHIPIDPIEEEYDTESDFSFDTEKLDIRTFVYIRPICIAIVSITN